VRREPHQARAVYCPHAAPAALAAVPVPVLPLPDTATLGALPPGRAGTLETLAKMRRLVREARTLPVIRNLAIAITATVKNKDRAGEVRAIHEWVKANIRYIRDVREHETLTAPAFTLALRAGDCDDHAMLVASLLEAIGHPARFAAVGTSPERFKHVFTETRLGQRWVSVETTEPVPVGWHPKLPHRLTLNI